MLDPWGGRQGFASPPMLEARDAVEGHHVACNNSIHVHVKFL